jgi:hypothetical protein
MNRFPRRVVGFCATGALLSTALAIPGAQALERPGVIQITAAEARHTHLDQGEKGKSIGDVDVYSSLLYNRRITTRPIGHATMLCTAVSTSNQSCSATYFLSNSEIVVQGVIGSRLIYALAVTGGTGVYDNVRGSLTVTSLHRKPVRELLVFRLVV